VSYPAAGAHATCIGPSVVTTREVIMMEPRLLMLLAVGTLLLMNGILDMTRRRGGRPDEGL
jgi:hypothetical protein